MSKSTHPTSTPSRKPVVERRDSAPTPPRKIPTPSPPKQPSSPGNKK